MFLYMKINKKLECFLFIILIISCLNLVIGTEGIIIKNQINVDQTSKNVSQNFIFNEKLVIKEYWIWIMLLIVAIIIVFIILYKKKPIKYIKINVKRV